MANLTNASDERTLRSRSLTQPATASCPATRTSAPRSNGIGSRPCNPRTPLGRRTRSSDPSGHSSPPTRTERNCGTCAVGKHALALYPSAAPSSLPNSSAAAALASSTFAGPASPKRPAANPCCLRRYGVCDHRRSWRCPDRACSPPEGGVDRLTVDAGRGARRRVEASGPCALFCGVGRGWRRACHCVATGRSIARRCSWAGSR